ncbi:glycosyltransferase [Archaeoglobus sp.]
MKDNFKQSQIKHENNKDSHPLISVIVVCRNARNTIRRCLNSIINQTYPNIEIVIVDSSEDETRDIIEEYRKKSKYPIKVIYQKPMGVGFARNTGIKNSSGDIICFIDADCYIPSDFIEKISKYFADGRVLSVSVDGKTIQRNDPSLFEKLVYYYDKIMLENSGEFNMNNTRIARKKLFDIIGLYNINLKSGEDAEIFERFLKKKDELIKKGFRFPKVKDTFIYEEKQETSLRKYYKKCMWYGEPLANLDYFKANPKLSIVKILFSGYIFMLPFILIYMIIFQSQYVTLVLLPFVLFYIAVVYKSITSGNISYYVALFPILIMYKYTFLFLGFLKALISKVIK